ncbi:uncharacterized protein LOC110278129 [Arachis duranensis]|uniref:Uncharacterized protein LOC110278129 n=1 Tax=Arachis duranensis TaxID=130453 RepID=A0A6P5N5S7_ARADU|nr:uncharacterized protein LOC110278129 [Arachis duranensis]
MDNMDKPPDSDPKTSSTPPPTMNKQPSNLTQDTTNPYYIHPSENPTSVLVTPVLTGNNYHSWKRSFTMAIISKNKYGFLTGSISSPLPGDPLFSAWEHCNNLVLSWLFHSLSPSITQSVLYFDTASSVWTDLKERFAQSDLLRIAELQEEIYALKQGTLSVTEFYTSLKSLWEELDSSRPLPVCSCPATSHRSQDFIIRFLKGLDERFSVVRSQILLLDQLPPATRVFALVIQHERQLQVTAGILDDPRSITAAVDSRHPSQGRGRGRSGFSSGKGRGSFPSSAGRGGSSKFCTHCGRSGHTIEVCYSKHGFPPGHPRHSGSPHHSAAVAVTTPPSIAPPVYDERAALGHVEGHTHQPNPNPILDLSLAQQQALIALLKRTESPSSEYRDNGSSNQNGFLPNPKETFIFSKL